MEQQLQQQQNSRRIDFASLKQNSQNDIEVHQHQEHYLDILQFNLGYYVECYLDEGGLSWVYKVSKGGEYYAVKIIEKRKYLISVDEKGKEEEQWNEEYFTKKLKEELIILEALKGNPCIIEPPSSLINTEKYWFLFHKFYNSGTLFSYLNKHANDQNIPNEETISYILRNILIALRDIHRSNVVHSDLKAQNVFFHNEQSQVKEDGPIGDSVDPLKCEIVLADFGFAALVNKKDSYISECYGSSRFYYAPEQVFNQKMKVSKSTDIWALGIIAYMMVFKRYPFLNEILSERFSEELTTEQKDTRINAESLKIDPTKYQLAFQQYMAKKKLKLEIVNDKEVSIDAINFMDKCLKYDYQERATAEELLLHPFIAKLPLPDDRMMLRNIKLELNFEQELEYSQFNI